MADAESKEQQEPTQATPPAPTGVGKIVPILLGANTVALVVVVALLAVQVVRSGGPRHAAAAEEAGTAPAPAHQEAPEKKVKEAPPGPTLRLADFVVHLRDPDADRYARVSFELELADEKAKEALTARIPQVRDAFLAYLSDCNTEELRGSEAMTRVKTALAGKLSQVAPQGAVRALYVTELVVQ